MTKTPSIDMQINDAILVPFAGAYRLRRVVMVTHDGRPVVYDPGSFCSEYKVMGIDDDRPYFRVGRFVQKPRWLQIKWILEKDQ